MPTLNKDQMKKRLLAIVDKAAAIKTRRSQLEGKLSALQAQWQSAIARLQEHGISSVEELKERMEELQREIEEKTNSIEFELKKYDELMAVKS